MTDKQTETNTETTSTDNANNAASLPLSAGDLAPDFTLPDAAGKPVSLSDYRGQRVIVYFYPKANTPGCTVEACDFRDSLAQLNDSNIAVIGISPDKTPALEKFSSEYLLNFPLLSDETREVMTRWGAYGEKKNYGKLIKGVIRSTFVVDPEGRIEVAKYNIKATGHVARLARELGVEG